MSRFVMSDAGSADRASRVRIGVIGLVVTVLVLAVAISTDRLPYIADGSTYFAYFDDVGGLASGDQVVLSGVPVGTVGAVELAPTSAGTKAKVTFSMADDAVVGPNSQAAIKTTTILGRRNLTVIPRGDGRLMPGKGLALGNTTAPYSLTDALDDTASTVAETDTDRLDAALDTLSATFSDTPDQVRGAVDGVASLSRAVAARDDALRELLTRARSVSDVIARRSGQINTLLVDANELLGELATRRTAIGELIVGVKDVTAQISGFIADNNEQLRPVLERLNRVLTTLEDNSNNLKLTLDRLGPYANQLGEAISSGPFFSSLVGITSFGDYTQVFLSLLQKKYPEAFRAFRYASPIPDPGGNVYTVPDQPSAPDLKLRPQPPLRPVP